MLNSSCVLSDVVWDHAFRDENCLRVEAEDPAYEDEPQLPSGSEHLRADHVRHCSREKTHCQGTPQLTLFKR